jgi:hypothetical protein
MSEYRPDDLEQPAVPGENLLDKKEPARVDLPSSADDYLAMPVPKPFVFEDLNLLQALELILYHPVQAGTELMRIVLNADRVKGSPFKPFAAAPPANPEWVAGGSEDGSGRKILTAKPSPHADSDQFLFMSLRPRRSWITKYLSLDSEQLGLVGILLFSILFALLGSGLLRESALDPQKRSNNDLGGSEFWFFMSALMYALAAIIQSRDWWQATLERLARRLERLGGVQPEAHLPLIDEQSPVNTGPSMQTPQTALEPTMSAWVLQSQGFPASIFAWVERHILRLFLVPIAMLLSWLAYDRNVATDLNGNITGIVFTRSGTIVWVLSIIAWYIIFMVDLNGLYQRIAIEREPLNSVFAWRLPRMHWRSPHIALLLIVLVAAYFRLHNLDEIPPEMTSDHIEKLINATEIRDGMYAMFFANNGGREAFQMYVVAAIADWGGVGFNFRALKYATVVEGILCVLLSFWVAKAMIGRDTEESERLGTWVGLAMAGLMAVSAWHTMLSRLGLRIVLTPLTTLLVMFFLARALRYSRRADFVHLGLVLGFGTYFYQANRMLPILVVAAVGLAIVFRARLDLPLAWRYTSNLALAGVIAIAIYLPMHRYAQQYPREFWSRTYGRMFGDRSFDCVDAQGRLDFCPPTLFEALDLLKERRYGPNGDMTGYEALRKNYKDAFISYMWTGDRQWITNGGGYPALDSRTTAFYMLGVFAWLVWLLRRRDVAMVVIPLGILIMLLPSALAIAKGLNENPSFTRISGTLPFVFFTAALALGQFAHHVVLAGRSRMIYQLVAAGILAIILYSAAGPNYDEYFKVYRTGYETSWRPYSQIAAPLHEFGTGRGSFGNAFYVHTNHWLDHRILGAVAGDFTWPNGLIKVEDVYQQMLRNQGTRYAYDPQRPLLFYIYPDNKEAIALLEQNFHGGQLREIPADHLNNFYVYEVPAGWDWLAGRLATETARLMCIINCIPGPR